MTSWDDDLFEPHAEDRVAVSLELTSSTLSADSITAVLGTQPDRSWSVGDRRKTVLDENHPKAYYEFSRWTLRSSLGRTCSDEDHLDALWDRCAGLADRITALSGNVAIYLSFYRSLDGRASQGHGFWVPERWTKWLGEVGGQIDVDQYVSRDGPDDHR